VAGATAAVDPLGDALLLKVNQAGSEFLSQTRVGGSDSENATAVTLDQYGNVYIVGPTRSASYPTTPGAFRTTTRAGWDAFVTKLQQ
jgi:hypothetical protein